MDIYSILTLIGGLAFFLYGISIMSSGLEKIAGSKLEKAKKLGIDISELQAGYSTGEKEDR